MPKTFLEILPALEERLEQANQGALPIGHVMELRRREKRQAMGCPSDEELCGFVDGELRGYSVKRWVEVRWHVHQCQPCHDDVEGLCEALDLDSRDLAAAGKPVRQRLSRFVAPVVAVAAALVLAFLGLQTYIPALTGRSIGINDISHVESPVQTPAFVDRHQTIPPEELGSKDTQAITPDPVLPVSRVAVCSETERPTCGDNMALMSVTGAKCEVVGDETSCSATSAAGGCAICLVTK